MNAGDEMTKFDVVIRMGYRVGMVGFLIGGGFGALASSSDPALVAGASAVVSAFQLGGVAAGVGLVGGWAKAGAKPVVPVR